MSKRSDRMKVEHAPVMILENGRVEIPVERVLPNPEQPRKDFDPLELENLAQSIRENGVILPIVVEQSTNGMFILHDGERRLRASKMAGLKTIPSVINPPLNGTATEDRLVRALVTNIQRADLGPIEEARAYQRLVEMGYSMNEIALKLGISSARVAQRLQLLKLDEPIQQLIEAGRLSKDARLASALLDIVNEKARVKMAQTLADRSVTIKAGVEACERLTRSMEVAADQEDLRRSPAMYMSVRRAGKVNRPVWDAMMQVGRVPPWPLVEISSRDTCERCALRDVASDTTCKGCALVDFLQMMIGSSRSGSSER